MRRRIVPGVAPLLGMWLMANIAVNGAQSASTPVEIPRNATALEGLPQVRIETTQDGAVRRELDATEAADSRLSIKIVDGRFFWAGREGRPLRLTSSGEFTYLMSAEPGEYVRFRRLKDRVMYVEHLDMPLGSVTYWGELRIVLDK